jgi:hypothetical protein
MSFFFQHDQGGSEMSDEFNELVVTPVKSQEQAAEVMDSARRGLRRSGYGRGIHGDHRFGNSPAPDGRIRKIEVTEACAVAQV